jgi:hypothetical protein
MQTHLISKEMDDLLFLDVNQKRRAIKTNLHSHFVSNTTVASFKHLRREEEASFGHTQFSAGKREESLHR